MKQKSSMCIYNRQLCVPLVFQNCPTKIYSSVLCLEPAWLTKFHDKYYFMSCAISIAVLSIPERKFKYREKMTGRLRRRRHQQRERHTLHFTKLLIKYRRTCTNKSYVICHRRNGLLMREVKL